jgi:ribonuclease R
MSRRKQPSRRQGTAGYRHSVPGPGVIVQVLEKQGVPLAFGALAELLEVRDDKSRKALRRSLQQLVSGGQLLINRKAEYCLLEKIDAVTGIVSAHPDGYGFLMPGDGTPDVYLPFQEMRALLHGDRVAVRVGATMRNGKRAGSVVEILERGKKTVVGEYQREHGVSFVVESGRIPHTFVVPAHQRGGAKPGELVKIEITEYPSERREGQGKVVRILGDPTDPGMITQVAIEQFEIPTEWNAPALAAAQALGDRVRISDKNDRVDLRDLPLVTIDGADARDFDDAVYGERSGDGWRLIVAIADVSHYVCPDSPLDSEARRRGTSVYFADQVVPMLPESLSNGLCSLKPNVDRLCMVCDMHVTEQGKVTQSRFYRGIMRSAARLTYDEVDRLQREKTSPGKLKNFKFISQINNLYGVFRSLERARQRRGALDLDLPEVVIQLNEAGRIERIVQRVRNDAHRLIEECMIAANVEAARFLIKHRLATLFRVHDGPDPDRFDELRLMLQTLGISVPVEARTDPQHLNRVLQRLAERPDYAALAIAVLRSLTQAVYQPANIGHFGLGLASYAHFTSPIRRYPDLLVHRGIGHILDNKKPGAFGYDVAAMEQAGQQCSMLERRAEEATRHVDARLKCAYIQDRVGEVLPGIVSGVTHFGLFVTLNDLNVDGLVHVSSIGHDYYHCEAGGTRMVGERTGASYGLGEAVTVRVMRVDIEQAKIDFELVQETPKVSAAASSDRGKRRKRTGRKRRAS